jgi:hypothetical protein
MTQQPLPTKVLMFLEQTLQRLFYLIWIEESFSKKNQVFEIDPYSKCWNKFVQNFLCKERIINHLSKEYVEARKLFLEMMSKDKLDDNLLFLCLIYTLEKTNLFIYL